MARLDGKVALVTGAGTGLGAQIARKFREEGAQLVINDISDASAQKVAQEVGGIGIAADVADSGAIKAMFEQVHSEIGRLDILVNNAGFGFKPGDQESINRVNEIPLKQMAEKQGGGPIETHMDLTVEMTDEDWHRMLAVHPYYP